MNLRGKWSHVACAVVTAIFLVTGLIGLDFGHHWDEYEMMIKPVIHSVENLTPLPGIYYYPSVAHLLCLVSLTLDVPFRLAATVFGPDRGHFLAGLAEFADSHTFLIQTRAVFLCVSALSIVWTYLAVWYWRRRGLEAALAAAFLALSWEVAYHSRWITVDPLLMQFGALTVLCLVRASHAFDKTWLKAAAVAAALGCGAKYPGGALLFSVLIGAWAFNVGGSPLRLARLGLVLVGIFSAVYLLTTPGTLLEPGVFNKHVFSEALRYAHAGGRFPSKTTAGWPHLEMMLTYLSHAGLSFYPSVALAFFGLSVVGLVVIAKEDTKLRWPILFFPLFYALFFSRMDRMIARNYLAFFPFLAIFASRGVGFLQDRIPPRWKWALPAAVGAGLAVNAVWLVRAAISIPMRSEERMVRDLSHYLDRHSDVAYLASAQVLKALADAGDLPRANLTSKDPEVGIFFASDIRERFRVRANRYNYTLVTFGSQEVNYNIYPTWLGFDRIVVMPIRNAVDIGVLKPGRDG